MIEGTEFVVETREETKINNVLLRDIPNDTAFLARSAVGEEELFAKFGGVVICLTRPSFFRSVDSSRFFDVKLMKEMVICVR